MQLGGFVLLVTGTLTYNAKEILLQLEAYYPRVVGHHEISSPSMISTTPAVVTTACPSRSHPLAPDHKPRALDDDDAEDFDEEENEEETHVGSYYANPVGSAPHGSYLASSFPRPSPRHG
mmetsp:Transcript_10470/g.21085  ORF Transcript_10470/g.21085 Transcript_10470/m.21085 type:complete len:120 (-) Transcript_10470:423-782(-)